MQRALDTKCPKLRQCKEEGTRTILILENNDIALTNHIVIGEAVRALLKGRNDVPDEIFLVDTCVDDWTVWSLYRDGVFWPDEETGGAADVKIYAGRVAASPLAHPGRL